MLHPHQKYLAFIPLSKSQTKPGPRAISHLLYIVFCGIFHLFCNVFFFFSSDIQSQISVLNSDRAAWQAGAGSEGGWRVARGGCSFWLLILLGLTTYTCLRQVSHCRTVDMEICSKFNSKYQVAPGKLFENQEGGGEGVVVTKWEGSCRCVCGKCLCCVCVCVCVRIANCAGNKLVPHCQRLTPPKCF